jgi:hypothetical protein
MIKKEEDAKNRGIKCAQYTQYRVSHTNITILFLSIICILSMLISSANVNALGIAPSKKIIDYDTEQHIITSRVINSETRDLTVKISANGELSKYIYISEPIIHIRSTESEKEFTYVLQLPPDRSPGPKIILITASETTESDNTRNDTVNQNNENAIGGMLTVTQQLQINVPYSGLYAEEYLSIYARDANAPINTLCEVVNSGDQVINSLSGKIIVMTTSDGDYTNTEEDSSKIVYSKDIDEQHDIFPKESARIEESFSLNETGTYIIECNISYDNKESSIRKNFNLGEYNITIVNASVKNFKLGTIAKFDINLVSIWNNDIDNVYGEVIVKERNGTIVGKTNISKTIINPNSNLLTAYLDTLSMKSGEYVLGIKLYAGNKVITKEYPATISSDKIEINTSSIDTSNATAIDRSSNRIRSAKTMKQIMTAVLILLAIYIIIILLLRQYKKIYK